MIEISALNLRFKQGNSEEIIALSDIHLNIPKYEYLVIVGENGSGKSSLLNCIAGSLKPNSGKIKIENHEITCLNDYQRSPWISRIFQNPLSGTASDLSILENFRLASLRTRKKIFSIGTNSVFKKQVKQMIAGLGMGLENKTDVKMGSLSGGQRQALTLLMAVMDDSRILLLDEPTAALDPKSSEKIMELSNQIINEYKLTAILVTHQMKEAIKYGTRIVQMKEGKIIRDLNSAQKNNIKIDEIYAWFE